MKKHKAEDAAENENDYVYIRNDIYLEKKKIMIQKSKLILIITKYSN